ncbi:MAG: hypothetical protein IKZ58_01925 [Selenomonadaceae bacterium]|nr:hypothetical protein [Selenomonadaceae bacterium]
MKIFAKDENLVKKYFEREAAIQKYSAKRQAVCEEGRKDGENNIFCLADKLYKAGRMEELSKMSSDIELRKNIYKEFNVNWSLDKVYLPNTDPDVQELQRMRQIGITSDEDFRKYYAILGSVMDYNSDMGNYRQEGLEKGENKSYRLIDALFNAGQQDDIAKLYADKTLCEKLYEEFNID